MRSRSMRFSRSLLSVLVLALATRGALAADWVELDNGFAYDKDSVRLDPRTGGEVIFRAPQTGTSVFHSDCDGYGASSPLRFQGAAREIFFQRTRSKIKPHTIYGFLYELVCE